MFFSWLLQRLIALLSVEGLSGVTESATAQATPLGTPVEWRKVFPHSNLVDSCFSNQLTLK